MNACSSTAATSAPLKPSPAGLRIIAGDAHDADVRTLAEQVTSAAWLAQARTIKADAKSAVYAGDVRLGDTDPPAVAHIVMKVRRTRWIDRVLGRTAALREARRARWLRTDPAFAMIDAAEPLAVLRCRAAPPATGTVDALVSRRLDGPTLLKALHDGSLTVADKAAAIDAFVRLFAAMRDRGVLHADCKPSNVIVLRRGGSSGDGPPLRLGLLDLAAVRRARRRRSASFLDAADERMLATLLIECLGTGTPVRIALRYRLLAAVLAAGSRGAPGATRAHRTELHARVRDAWRRISDRIDRHKRREGALKPSHDPLSFDAERSAGPR